MPRSSAADHPPALNRESDMADVASVASALAAVKTSLEIAKGLRAGSASLESAELKMKILELVEALGDARQNLLDAQDEIRALRTRIAELEHAGDVRSRLVRRDRLFYLPDGESESGPYCPRCVEAENKLITLNPSPSAFVTFGEHRCPECNKFF